MSLESPEVSRKTKTFQTKPATERSQVKTDVINRRTTHFLNDFSREVFEQTYRYGTECDVNDRHINMARDLAGVEKSELRDKWTERFADLLENFRFVPGGRITSNAGTGLKGTTYINCFVSGFRGTHQDSMESIMDELKRQALILKSEGGYGFCVDVLRPRGAFVSGIGGDSPGPVKLLEMWDTQSGVITAGSDKKQEHQRGKKKIRKGAQMVTMSVTHPDIEEFIMAKQTPNRLTKFNMSVLVTDEFMEAVKKNAPWSLEFPDHEAAPEAYAEHWDGNLAAWKAKALPIKVYKRFEEATALWNLIMTSTYNRNEPGVLFIDTINRLNNLYYAEHINATNPCGEQVLPVGGCCLLGSLNLTQFVNSKVGDWDWAKLKETIPTAVRFMDNVNDRTSVPLLEQRENLRDKRRIGLGIMGYGSALIMMKTRYGSDAAIEKTEKLMRFIMNEAYRASALLAKEKGAFPLFDADKYLKGAFVQSLDSEVKALIREHGLRNSHLLSIQPTGNSSVLANNVSGGLEPVFMPQYVRTSMQPHAPEGLDVPKKIDWANKTYDLTASKCDWTWAKEGDENILVTRHDGEVWKMDASRGLLKETRVRDYAVVVHDTQGTWDSGAEWAASAFDLGIDDHVRTMNVFSRFIDSAMSKTVNIPKDYPYEDFKRLYLNAYESRTIKGCTSYREGTMTSVLSAGSSLTDSQQKGIPRTKAMKRPKILDCDIHHLVNGGDKWVVMVGLYEEDPYEVFAMKQDRLHLPNKLIRGKLIKAKSGVYSLRTEDGWSLENIATFFESNEQEALTRMISTSLRHGADIEFIVSQLIKSEGTITSFSKAIARTLKTYITEFKATKCPQCKSTNVYLSEGCVTCKDCGDSKCN